MRRGRCWISASAASSRRSFEIDPFRKHSLLNGLDDIGQTLQHGVQIDDFEAERRESQPWLPSTAT